MLEVARCRCPRMRAGDGSSTRRGYSTSGRSNDGLALLLHPGAHRAMKSAYLPPVSHVLPLTIVRRDRTLPIAGTGTARLNERVQAVAGIAEAEPAPRHVYLG